MAESRFAEQPTIPESFSETLGIRIRAQATCTIICDWRWELLFGFIRRPGDWNGTAYGFHGLNSLDRLDSLDNNGDTFMFSRGSWLAALSITPGIQKRHLRRQLYACQSREDPPGNYLCRRSCNRQPGLAGSGGER